MALVVVLMVVVKSLGYSPEYVGGKDTMKQKYLVRGTVGLFLGLPHLVV